MRQTFPTFLVCAALSAQFLGENVFAQDYPQRPIRLVVPYGPGGSTDILARILSQKLSEQFGHQVIVDNRAGASGNIGANIVAKAVPDGYTLLMGAASTNAINPSLYRHMPYDAAQDFTPITRVAAVSNVFVVLPATSMRSISELVALAKSQPGKLTSSNGGAGDMTYLAGELFKSMAGLKIVAISYKSGSEAATAVLTKDVDMAISGVPVVMPHITGARLHPLAVTSVRRSSALPSVPTVAESGYPGYEADGWFGVFVPAAIPRQLVTKLNQEIVKILKMPETQQRLARIGAEVVGDTPEQFGAFVKSETAKWKKVINDSGTPLIN